MTRIRLDQDSEHRILEGRIACAISKELSALPSSDRLSSTEMSFSDRWPERISSRWSDPSPASRDVQRLLQNTLVELVEKFLSHRTASDEMSESDDSLIELVSHHSLSSHEKKLTVTFKHEPRPSKFKIDIDNDY